MVCVPVFRLTASKLISLPRIVRLLPAAIDRLAKLRPDESGPLNHRVLCNGDIARVIERPGGIGHPAEQVPGAVIAERHIAALLQVARDRRNQIDAESQGEYPTDCSIAIGAGVGAGAAAAARTFAESELDVVPPAR